MARHKDALLELKRLIKRVGATKDLGLLTGRRADAVIGSVRSIFELSGGSDFDAAIVLGWVAMLEFDASGKRDQDALERAVSLLLPPFLAGRRGDMPRSVIPLLVQRGYEHTHGLYEQAEASGNSGDMSEAVRVWELLADAAAPDHPGRWWIHDYLGLVLRARYELDGDAGDLDAAVRHSGLAVENADVTSPQYGNWLSNASVPLRIRYERSGEEADLTLAVKYARAAVEEAPLVETAAAARYANLGFVLLVKYELWKQRADLDEAVHYCRLAVDSSRADDRGRVGRMSNLAATLRARHECTGALPDLDQAIRILAGAIAAAESLQLGPQPPLLNNLSVALLHRFLGTGDLTALDEAARHGREALLHASPHDPGTVRSLSNLALILRNRHQRTYVAADLDEAIKIGRRAVEMSRPEDPDLPGRLSSLALALSDRADRALSAADARKVVEVARRAINLDRRDSGTTVNLAIALRELYERTREPAALDEAVSLARTAAESTDAQDPSRARWLSNLAGYLESRYQRTRNHADLHEAQAILEQAARVPGTGAHLRMASLFNAARLIANDEQHRTAEASAHAAALAEESVLLLPELAPRRLPRSDRRHALAATGGMATYAAALMLQDASVPESRRALRALSLLETGRAVLLGQGIDARSDLARLRLEQPRLADRYAHFRDLLDREDPSELRMDAGLDSGANTASIGGTSGRVDVAERLAETLEAIRSTEGFNDFALPPSVDLLLAESGPGPIITLNVAHRSDALLLTEHGVRAIALPALGPATVAAKADAFHRALIDVSRLGADRGAARTTLTSTLEWLWDAAAAPVLEALGYHGTPSPTQPWPRIWWITTGHLSRLPVHAAGYHSDPSTPHRRAVLDRAVSSYTPTIRALRHARRAGGSARSAESAPPGSLIVAMPTTPQMAEAGDLPGGLARGHTRILAAPRSRPAHRAGTAESSRRGDRGVAGLSNEGTRA